MMDELLVELGARLDAVEAQLRDAGIEFTSEYLGNGLSGAQCVDFEHGGCVHAIRFGDLSEVVEHVRAIRPLADLDEGIRRVREIAARRGAPVEVFQITNVLARIETIEWIWGDGLVASVARERERPWELRIERDVRGAYTGRPSVELDGARGLVGQIDASLAAAPPAEGERGAAVARWLELHRWAHQAAVRFVDVIAATTPSAAIARRTLDELAEHATWLAQHDRLFDQPDDWRDAVVVGGRDQNRGVGGPLGWQVDFAREGEREVRIVVGPFATGVHRALRTPDELYPLRDELAAGEVELTTRAKAESLKLTPDTVVASYRGVTAELTGLGDGLRRAARLLVLGRARRRDG